MAKFARSKRWGIMVLSMVLAGGGLLFPTPGHTDAAGEWRSALYPADWLPVNEGGAKDAQGRFLHDFSYAGYHLGENAIPTEPSGTVYDVTQPPYLADATGVSDATEAIQQALDDAGNAGGGTVYLPSGTYRVKPQGTNGYALWIRRDNVVLRGGGKDQTFIFNDEAYMRDKSIIRISPVANADWHTPIDTAVTIATDLPDPTTEIPLQDVSGYSVGEWVVVRADATDAFLAEHDSLWVGHGEELKGPTFYRQITAVDPAANTISIDIPTRYPLKTRDNARVYRIAEPIREVGVEQLSIGNRQNANSGWGSEDYKTPGTGAYEVHTSNGIYFVHALNGWVDQVNSYRPSVNASNYHLLSDGIELFQSRSITVQNVHMQKPQYKGGGGNGYGITIRGSDNLIQDSVFSNNRHNYSFKSMWSTGNVILRCSILSGMLPADFHMHLSMANLIDNATVNNDILHASGRGTGGTIPHGQTTTQSVFWNTRGIAYKSGNSSIIYSKQYKNGYIIGTQGAAAGVTTDTSDWKEGVGLGATLMPQSLYQDQLYRRTGIVPPETPQNEPEVVWMDESFDAGTAGMAPAGWTVTGGGGTATVENEPGSGGKSLRLLDTSLTGEVNADKVFPARTGPITVTFEAKADTRDAIIRAGYLSGGGNDAVNVYFDQFGQFAYYDGNTKMTLQDYAANTWYRFKIVADTDAGKFDLYIDDMQMPIVSQASFRNPVGSLDTLRFGTNVSRMGKGNIDNVKVAVQPYLYADFEEDAYGATPSGWTIAGGGGTVTVATTPGGDKSMRLNDTSTSAEVNAERSFAAQAGTVTVEFDAKVDATYGIVRAGYLYGGGVEAVFVYFDQSGTIAYYDGNAKVNSQTYAAGIWYHFKIVADPVADTYDLYIDDMATPVVSQAGFRNPVASLDKILFGTNPSRTGKGNIDNVRVY